MRDCIRKFNHFHPPGKLRQPDSLSFGKSVFRLRSIIAIAVTIACIACQNSKQESRIASSNYDSGTFGYDLEFLKKRDSIVVLKSGDAQVIVSPKYQGKVFTSTAEGNGGQSFGWVNYLAFDKGIDPHMNAYGGENRLWLGPEGNRFSLFFKPGTAMTFENWFTPPPIDTETWNVDEQNERTIRMTKQMDLTNYAATQFKIHLSREVGMLDAGNIEEMLGIALSEDVKHVGYTTVNTIRNAGENAWTPESGAPCLWILDMFKPSPSTWIIVPFKTEGEGEIVTSDYFGKISDDRLLVRDSVVLFRADGQSRGKIGISPQRARPLAGSFDPENKILTLVVFDLNPEAVYLNQEWTIEKDPFAGDAVNAYNDGPLEDGTQMGPFYELESVSPAAYLRPSDSLVHRHSVMHFTGNGAELRAMIDVLFGPGSVL